MTNIPVPLRKQGPSATRDSLSYPGPLLSQEHGGEVHATPFGPIA